jgi:hypothetical protein
MRLLGLYKHSDNTSSERNLWLLWFGRLSYDGIDVPANAYVVFRIVRSNADLVFGCGTRLCRIMQPSVYWPRSSAAML